METSTENKVNETPMEQKEDVKQMAESIRISCLSTF